MGVHQVGAQSSVHGDDSLFLPDGAEAVYQAGVLWPAAVHGPLSHARADDLMGVCESGGEQLRGAGSAELAAGVDELVPGGHRPSSVDDVGLPPGEVGLHPLVEHPLQRALGDAEVARRQPTVETPDALLADHLLHAIETVLVLSPRAVAAARGRLVKL